MKKCLLKNFLKKEKFIRINGPLFDSSTICNESVTICILKLILNILWDLILEINDKNGSLEYARVRAVWKLLCYLWPTFLVFHHFSQKFLLAIKSEFKKPDLINIQRKVVFRLLWNRNFLKYFSTIYFYSTPTLAV